MNQHVMDWAAALRSGRYTQGQHYLRNRTTITPTYCCLGVAAEMADCPELMPGRNPDMSLFDYIVRSDGSETATQLPEWLADLLGLHSHDMRELARLNDGGKSFIEIADLLEAWQKLGGAERQTLTSFWRDVLAGRTGG